ncbi:phenylalanine--tRNA ligase subunit beta [Merismopedia glauca]|uniref:Phenylalanine--tRNA ligase beta subunit n=1 Tax=Merismopedia glauca CCAP 1448/3 TaxID=1296344 RepID=A0A2T1BWW5_9CYAN|nr:phenylalanine--tRNA ligase subunit beta [Merismopedia glauca]PSB00448.1 phenylalanine--tRNA ligase subunit beta [Merismopedia glauca CCAP 1448/3]
MRISLNWLQELVEFSLSPEKLAETLTLAGFEVEDIEDRRTWGDGVVVGKVLQREPHPNADKLSVCQVDVGSGEPLNIVCGAPNVRADIYVAVAVVGTYLPIVDLKIKPAKLRGVRSEGMICSLAELGLLKESPGIHIFEADNLKLGQDVRPFLGLDDVIFDLTSTANRADALSMVGIAREVAALTGGKLKLPEIPTVSYPDLKETLQVRVSETKACPVYIGTAIANLKIAPSPDWLQRRLQSVGVRPINNVVDVTNYILWEWGQPLHAFDGERLQAVAGSKPVLGVRFAQAGETFKTLDSQSRTLQTQNLLITAGNVPVALAGVMGGEETEVHSGTTSLVLEAAIFDSASIRRSARAQGLRTEASTRYERGVNLAELDIACQRAINLMTELAGGTVVSQAKNDARPDPSSWTRTIKLRLERVNLVLGPVDSEENPEILADDVERILTALGCHLKATSTEEVWQVTVPPYRYRDLEREIDLIEEIARLYGYNRFADTLPEKTEAGYLSFEEELTRKLREALRASGLTELVHYSYALVKDDSQVAIANPMFTEYSSLRTELVSGLINSFQYNLEQGNGALNGFEIGKVFWTDEDGLAEADSVAGILGGDIRRGNWVRGGKEQPLTWYEAKGILEGVFEKIGLSVEYQPDFSNRRFHPGRTASLWSQGERLGTFGQLHPQLCQEKDLPNAVYVFDLDLDLILERMEKEEIMTPRFQAYSTYPASDRDIAFFAPVDLSLAEIQKAITKAGGELLTSVELFDEYRGENVPEGQRSLALRLVYRLSDRTLTDAEVEPVHQKVREVLLDKFQVSLRS